MLLPDYLRERWQALGGLLPGHLLGLASPELAGDTCFSRHALGDGPPCPEFTQARENSCRAYGLLRYHKRENTCYMAASSRGSPPPPLTQAHHAPPFPSPGVSMDVFLLEETWEKFSK